MATDDTALPAEQLLEALERAGRTPDIELIRACLDQRDELRPALLAWLAEDADDDAWPEDDPRWYRQIHAGHLLLAWRDEALLPIFERWLRAPDPFDDTPIQWFDTLLHTYGPPSVPMLAGVVADPGVESFGRSLAAGALTLIAGRHPEQRDAAVAALRAVLPEVRPEEKRRLTGQEQDADLPAVWAWAAWYLSELHDQESRERIVALHQADMIDESIAGGLDDYLQRMDSDEPVEDRYGEFDIIKTYEGLQRQAEQDARWRAEAERRAAEEQRRREENAARLAEIAAIKGALPPEKLTQLGREGHAGGTFVRTTPKVGRNDPCPCGSGRKYKHCHGK
jgi:hypothetical protein